MNTYKHESKPENLKFNRQFFIEFWRLFKPFWTSKEKNSALSMLILNIGCILIGVWSSVKINEFNRDFYDALGKFDQSGIISTLGHFTVLLAIAILVYGYASYFNLRITIQWQRWLTQNYQKQWLSNHTYYHMQISEFGIDNPDQRVSEDLEQFASHTLSIFLNFLQSILTLASFGYVLWSLSGDMHMTLGSHNIRIPGYLCWAAFLYAVAGTYIISKMGKTLSGLDYRQQQFNADFRYGLIRLRENSEQIAILGGEEAEKSKLDLLFQRIYTNFLSISVLQKNLAFFTNGYNILANIVGIIFCLPVYLAKKIQLGGLMQTASAFSSVISAFSIFINSFYQLTQWRAVIHRLTEMNQNIRMLQTTKEKSAIIIEKTPHFAIEIQNLYLASPTGEKLIGNINLNFERGQSFLLCGPSGLGKSTLMRSIAGAWCYGSGYIRVHQDAQILLLPQKPYLPIGTLEEALVYPCTKSIYTTEQLQTILKHCLLDKFCDQLSTSANWTQRMSLGEQQLLALGRVLLHKPDIVCLDESTSALDETKEAHIYACLRQELPHATIISVGHRSSLLAFHDNHIYLDKHSTYEEA